jgi:hypothetical protein
MCVTVERKKELRKRKFIIPVYEYTHIIGTPAKQQWQQ